MPCFRSNAQSERISVTRKSRSFKSHDACLLCFFFALMSRPPSMAIHVVQLHP